MASAARTQHACEQASIRDLMERFATARQTLDHCTDAEWNAANDADVTAALDLMTALVAATGLTPDELRNLGGMI